MSRDGLIRVLVTDKNGVQAMRWVVDPSTYGKPAAAPPAEKKLPPPLISVGELTKTDGDDGWGHKLYVKGLARQKGVKSAPSKWRYDVDDSLRAVCTEKYNPETKIRCSGEEIYDIMSTVDDANILPLLSVGVRSGEEAREFLTEHELDHLIIDNAHWTKERIENDMDPFFSLTYTPTGSTRSSSSMSIGAKVGLSPTIPYRS